MRKMSKQWTVRLGALTLAVACLGTVAALAAGGDRDDPLVTLSYLNDTALPQVVKQVEERAAVLQQELKEDFAQLLDQQQPSGGQGGSSGASYTLVTLGSGQTMSLEVGCEVLLRVGSATVQAATSPALIDISTGGEVGSGTSLTKNHLYMATIPDRTLTAGSGDVKLLVRGGYSIT